MFRFFSVCHTWKGKIRTNKKTWSIFQVLQTVFVILYQTLIYREWLFCMDSQWRRLWFCWGCPAEPRPWSWHSDSAAGFQRRLSSFADCPDRPAGPGHSCHTLERQAHLLKWSSTIIVFTVNRCQHVSVPVCSSHFHNGYHAGPLQVRCTHECICHIVFLSSHQDSGTPLCGGHSAPCSHTLERHEAIKGLTCCFRRLIWQW